MVKVNESFVAELKKVPSSEDSYLFQKMIYGPISFPKLKKQAEFEVITEIMRDPRIHSICTVVHQQEILGYYPDSMFVLNPTLLKEGPPLPELFVEINENGHKSYSKEKQKKRADVMRALGCRFLEFDVPRGATIEKYHEIAQKASSKIAEMLGNILIEYNPEINADAFIDKALSHNIERDFVYMFFPKEPRRNSRFFININKAGPFLGYYEDKNGPEKAKKLVKKYLKLDGHYEIEEEVTSGKPLGGRPKKIYWLSRTGFYLMCVHSKKEGAKLVQIKMVTINMLAIDYTISSRAKQLMNRNDSVLEKHEILKDRVNEISERNISRTNVSKLTTQVTELKTENKEKTVELEDANKKLVNLEKCNQILGNQVTELGAENAEARDREQLMLQYMDYTMGRLKEKCSKHHIEYEDDASRSDLVRLLLEIKETDIKGHGLKPKVIFYYKGRRL
jgi:hypothetical protein